MSKTIEELAASLNYGEWDKFVLERNLKFPLSLDKILFVWIPKTKSTERLPIYRDFLRNHPRLGADGNSLLPSLSENEVLALIQKHRHNYFDRGQFERFTRMFIKFLPTLWSLRKTRRSRAGAKARWKEKSKKNLDAKKGSQKVAKHKATGVKQMISRKNRG